MEDLGDLFHAVVDIMVLISCLYGRASNVRGVDCSFGNVAKGSCDSSLVMELSMPITELVSSFVHENKFTIVGNERYAGPI